MSLGSSGGKKNCICLWIIILMSQDQRMFKDALEILILKDNIIFKWSKIIILSQVSPSYLLISLGLCIYPFWSKSSISSPSSTPQHHVYFSKPWCYLPSSSRPSLTYSIKINCAVLSTPMANLCIFSKLNFSWFTSLFIYFCPHKRLNSQ